MNYQTSEQLSEMKLNAMKLEYQRQQELPAITDLDFDERFSMIVNEQYSARQDAKVRRLIKAANLREPTANIASIDHRSWQDIFVVRIRQGCVHEGYDRQELPGSETPYKSRNKPRRWIIQQTHAGHGKA